MEGGWQRKREEKGNERSVSLRELGRLLPRHARQLSREDQLQSSQAVLRSIGNLLRSRCRRSSSLVCEPRLGSVSRKPTRAESARVSRRRRSGIDSRCSVGSLRESSVLVSFFVDFHSLLLLPLLPVSSLFLLISGLLDRLLLLGGSVLVRVGRRCSLRFRLQRSESVDDQLRSFSSKRCRHLRRRNSRRR